MASDNSDVIAQYGKMYNRIFRYGPIITGFLVASVLSFFLLRYSSDTMTTVVAQDDNQGIIQEPPTDTNAGTRDDSPTTGKDTTEPRKDSIAYKNTNYNLDKLIADIPLWSETNRKHTDNNTIISTSYIIVDDLKKELTLTIDHSSGVNFSLLQINTDYDDINQNINALIAEKELAPAKVFDSLHQEFKAKTHIELTCLALEEQLTVFGEIECDNGFVHVSIVNESYQRSYYFHHKNFALLSIESSDTNETQALSSIANIQTTSKTIGQAIERILEKRLELVGVEEGPQLEGPSLAVSKIFADTFGSKPTSVSEKDGSFGVHFTLQDIHFFGIYDLESATIKGLLFVDAKINGKPLSVPNFSLDLRDSNATQNFRQDPLDFLESIKEGITEAYSSTDA